MPKIIQRGNLVASLRSRFGLVGRTPFALDETVVPTVSVGDLDDARFTPFWGGDRVAAVAAQTGQHAIQNPTGSSKLLIVDFLIVSLATGSGPDMRQDGNLATWATIATTPRDTTRPNPVGTVHTISSGAVFGGPLPVADLRMLANLSFKLPLGIVLGPGRNLLITAGGTNITSAVIWYWRETDALTYALNAS